MENNSGSYLREMLREISESLREIRTVQKQISDDTAGNQAKIKSMCKGLDEVRSDIKSLWEKKASKKIPRLPIWLQTLFYIIVGGGALFAAVESVVRMIK